MCTRVDSQYQEDVAIKASNNDSFSYEWAFFFYFLIIYYFNWQQKVKFDITSTDSSGWTVQNIHLNLTHFSDISGIEQQN